MGEKIINIFFPRTCPVCGKIVKVSGELICKECKREVRYISEPKCQKCGKRLKENVSLCKDCKEHKHEYDRGVCVFEYAGPIKESMYRFKYKNAREYGEFYGLETAKRYKRLFDKWNIDCIMAVPMYKKKEVARGYNQAYVFAKAVSKYTGIPIIDKCLVRTKNTIPQKEMIGIQRKKNLENAFAIYKGKIKDYKRVLIVDDIYTTGSTIDACAGLLKAAGVEEVCFLCISTGVL